MQIMPQLKTANSRGNGEIRLRAFALFLGLAVISTLVCAQDLRGLEPRAAPFQPLLSGQSRSLTQDDSLVTFRAAPGRRMALVVGNANYQQLPKLKNAVNDAEDMCASLVRLEFEVTCHYNVFNRSDFRQVIKTFASVLNSDTVALFYYAGHGVQINGENFLLPVSVDARVSLDMEDDSLNLSYLLRSLEGARSSPNIVILDACRNNPFERVPGGRKGLARIDPPVGTVLVYSTAPNGVAEDGNGRNGLFTKHLLEHIGEPGQKLDELFQVIAAGVEQEAQEVYKTRQIPYRSFSFSGSYCLAGCEDPKVTAQIELIKRQSEEAGARVKILTEENARLSRQTEERAGNVITLEARINSLVREAASVGDQKDSGRLELSRLQASLNSARKDQIDAERLKKEAAKRETEINELKAQMAALSGKANQLEEYRLRIAALERDNADKTRVSEEIDQVKRLSEEATKRVQMLADENAKLRRQADERNASVLALETRIAILTREAASAGSNTNSARSELARLQVSLETARAGQKFADATKGESVQREQEISELKRQIGGLQEKSNQLEALRSRIVTLERENADQTRQLNKKEPPQVKTRPTVIPLF